MASVERFSGIPSIADDKKNDRYNSAPYIAEEEKEEDETEQDEQEPPLYEAGDLGEH